MGWTDEGYYGTGMTDGRQDPYFDPTYSQAPNTSFKSFPQTQFNYPQETSMYPTASPSTAYFFDGYGYFLCAPESQAEHQHQPSTQTQACRREPTVPMRINT